MLKRRHKKKDPWLTQPRATVIAAIIAMDKQKLWVIGGLVAVGVIIGIVFWNIIF